MLILLHPKLPKLHRLFGRSECNRVNRTVRSECKRVNEAVRSKCNKVNKAVRSQYNRVSEAVHSKCNKMNKAVRSECNRVNKAVNTECKIVGLNFISFVYQHMSIYVYLQLYMIYKTGFRSKSADLFESVSRFVIAK